jgi:hypothetical protein
MGRHPMIRVETGSCSSTASVHSEHWAGRHHPLGLISTVSAVASEQTEIRQLVKRCQPMLRRGAWGLIDR